MRIAESTMGFFKYLFRKPKDEEKFYEEKTVQILCLGKEGVGKTSVIQKLCSNNHQFVEEYLPTIYDDYLKNTIVDEYDVTLKFMDMGGSQSFPSMQEVFIRQADMYILFYAVDDVESFERMLQYRDKITSIKEKHTTQLPLIVVRNKCELKQKRLRKEANRRKTINKWCGKVYDVSAKTGLKINAIMDSLLEESKFIGNQVDLGDVKISGRYIYQDETEKQVSEVYHKAPNVFREPDNSDEKMEKRRRRSIQHQTRKMSRAQTRRHSFSSMAALRRISKIQPPNREVRSLDTDVKKKDMLQQSIEVEQKAELPVITKSPSKDSIVSSRSNGSNTSKDAKKNSPSLDTHKNNTTANSKRNKFKVSGKDDTIDKLVVDSPKLRRGLRKKSLSSNDLTLQISRGRLRSCSVGSPKSENKTSKPMDIASGIRQRSISVVQRPKTTKVDIVHTTLRERLPSDGNIPIVPHRNHGRSSSFASREGQLKTTPKSKISVGRRVSTSIDTVSDTESLNGDDYNGPPSHTLKTMSLGRRRSLSQNDLSNGLQRFHNENNAGIESFQRSISVNPGATMGRKKQKISLPSRISEDVASLISASPGIVQRRTQSIPKKISVQGDISSPEFVIREEDGPTFPVSTRHRKISISTGDLVRIDEFDLDIPCSSSYDENKNSILFSKTKRRAPLQKNSSIDETSSPSSSLMKVKHLLSSAASIGKLPDL